MLTEVRKDRGICMLPKKINNFIFDDSGIATVLVTLGLVVIMGCAALVIDAGMLYSARMKASNAVDAAVMAGVRELPDDPTTALSLAQTYAQANGVDPSEVTFTIGYNDEGQAISITGDVDTDMNMLFARVLGINTGDVKAHAKARVGPAASVSGGEGVGIVPFGLTEDLYAKGTEIILREGAGDGDTGWNGYLALPPTSFPVNLNQDLWDNIEWGYDGDIYEGQVLDVKTGVVEQQAENSLEARIDRCTDVYGHVPECTWEVHYDDCPRLVVVPLGTISADTKLFTVTGFATIFLWKQEDPMTGVDCIMGYFLEEIEVVAGEIDDSGTITESTVYAAELCE